MATMCRCTAWFKDKSGKGWTEKIYILSATTLGFALPAARNWLFARVALLGKGPKVERAIVSFDDTYRDALPVLPLPTYDLLGDGYAFYTATANTDGYADVPWNVLQLRAYGNSGSAHANLYLSGIADRAFHDGIFDPSPGWSAYFLLYRNLLCGGGAYPAGVYGFKVLNKDAVAAPLLLADSAASSAVPPLIGTYQTIHLRGNNLAVGDYFRFSVRKGPMRPLNGLHQVAQVLADGVTVAFKVPSTKFVNALVGTTPMATVQKQVYQLTPYQDLVIRKPTRRKRGAGFLHGRGRRRAVRTPLSLPVA